MASQVKKCTISI